MADEIERIAQVIAISHKALIAIRQNVVFSMSWNVLLGLPRRIWGDRSGGRRGHARKLSALPALVNSARIIQDQPRAFGGSMRMDDVKLNKQVIIDEITHSNHTHPAPGERA